MTKTVKVAHCQRCGTVFEAKVKKCHSCDWEPANKSELDNPAPGNNELSRQSTLDKAAISKWRRGILKLGVSGLSKIAKALGVPIKQDCACCDRLLIVYPDGTYE